MYVEAALEDHMAAALKSPLLSPKQAARYLACKELTLARWRTHRKGPAYVRVGRRPYYLQSALDEWIAGGGSLQHQAA